MRVDLVNIANDWWAFAVRSVLECYGITVTLHPIATAADLVRALGGATPISEHVILECHGDGEGRLYLPELAPSVAATQPYRGALTAANLREFLRLPDCLVLNAGCSLGTPEFAQVFLQAGCRAYIGADGDPDGEAALLYVVHFFYELHCRGRSLEEAHERAASHDSETGLFRVYQRTEPVSLENAPVPAG